LYTQQSRDFNASPVSLLFLFFSFFNSKASLVGARVDRSGIVKQRWELANTPAAVLPVLKQLKQKYKHLVVASEATGDH
jgi:hypothetical protein